jgi:hypothetical protein
MAVITAVLSALLLTSLLVTLPLGGPGRAPEMNPSAVRAVSGVVHVADETDSRTGLSRTLEFEVEDPRIDGRASVALDVSFETADMYHYRGTMRLDNAWGAWEGPVEIAGYPTGEEVGLARLAGEDAFEGFTYVYAIHGQNAGAERAVEGAIWPDEQPSMPDPSSLP